MRRNIQEVAALNIFYKISPKLLFIVFVACIGNARDKRNFLIWIDDLGLNTDEYIYIMPKTNGEGMTTKSIAKKSNKRETNNPKGALINFLPNIHG